MTLNGTRQSLCFRQGRSADWRRRRCSDEARRGEKRASSRRSWTERFVPCAFAPCTYAASIARRCRSSMLNFDVCMQYPSLRSSGESLDSATDEELRATTHTTVNASRVEDEAWLDPAPRVMNPDDSKAGPQPRIGESPRYASPATYADIKVREKWADSIAQRVSKSPDSRMAELQLLEAQLARAKAAAKLACDERDRLASEASAAAEDAERAKELAARLAEEVRQCKEEAALMSRGRKEQETRGLSLVSAQSSGEAPVLQSPAGTRSPTLVVLELEGAIFEDFDDEPLPPFYFSRKGEEGGVVKDALGTPARICAGALEVLTSMRTDPAMHSTKVAVLSRLHTPGTADALLEAIDLGDGLSAKDAADFVVMCPSLGKSLSVSETLRATMAKSSMESLRRRTRVEFADMLYLGPGSRACRDLTALGIACKRLPYGLSVGAWQEALGDYGV